MRVSEVIAIPMAIIFLAGITVVIVNGGNTARVLQSAGDSFAGLIRAATMQKA